ncbi:hypothetical protein CYMTET_22377, partial [Cymbomonas tetramitiformis]
MDTSKSTRAESGAQPATSGLVDPGENARTPPQAHSASHPAADESLSDSECATFAVVAENADVDMSESDKKQPTCTSFPRVAAETAQGHAAVPGEELVDASDSIRCEHRAPTNDAEPCAQYAEILEDLESLVLHRGRAQQLEESEAFEALARCQGDSIFFRGFDEAELHLLARLAPVVGLAEGELLSSSGDAASFVGVLAAGKVDVMRRQDLVGEVFSGDLLGEGGFFSGTDRGVDLISGSGGCLLLILAFDDIEDIHLEFPDLGLKLLRSFAASALCTLDRVRIQAYPKDGYSRGRSTIVTSSTEIMMAQVNDAYRVRQGLGWGLSTEDIEVLVEKMHYMRLEPGEPIQQQGGPATGFWFVLDGMLGEDREGLEIRYLKRGDLHGGESYLLRDGSSPPVHPAAVTAVEPSTVAVLPYSYLDMLREGQRLAVWRFLIEAGRQMLERHRGSMAGPHQEAGPAVDLPPGLTPVISPLLSADERSPEMLRQAEAVQHLDYCRQYNELWTGLTRGDILDLARWFKVLHVLEGDKIARVGEAVTFVGVVTTGFALEEDEDGAQHRVPGSLFGESELFCAGVRQHSIIAGSDGTSVACLEHAALEAMNMELPALARKLMGIFARIAMHRADSISRGMTDEEWLQPVTGTSVQQNATQRLLVDHACGFSDKEIMAVNACLKFVEVKAEEEVIGHGTTCQCLCMVVAGKLAKYADGKQSACLGHYEPGDIFGEHAVIAQPWHPLPLSGHTVTATSMTPCALIAVLTPEALITLNEGYPSALTKLMTMAVKKSMETLRSRTQEIIQQKGRKPQKQKKRATFAAAAQTTLQSEKASQLVKRVAGLEAQADLHKAYTSQFGLRLRTRGLAVGASASSMMAVLGRGGCSELQLARILMEFQEINESFRGFSAKECGVLAARMAMVEIPAGDFVQMEGDPCTCVLLVVQGALHTHHGKGGVKTHVTPCGAIHGAAGLFKPGTRTTDVYSSPDKGVTVLVLFFDQIAVLERSHPATCVKLHRAIGRSALHDLRLHLPVVAVQGDSVPAGHCEEGMLNNWQMTKFSWMEKQEMVTPVHRAARDAGMPGLGELDATDLGVTPAQTRAADGRKILHSDTSAVEDGLGEEGCAGGAVCTLMHTCESFAFEKDQYLIHRGQVGTGCIFLLSGQVVAVDLQPQGRSRRDEGQSPPTFFFQGCSRGGGALDLHNTTPRHPVGFRAHDSGTALFFSMSKVMRQVDAYPELVLKLLCACSEQVTGISRETFTRPNLASFRQHDEGNRPKRDWRDFDVKQDMDVAARQEQIRTVAAALSAAQRTGRYWHGLRGQEMDVLARVAAVREGFKAGEVVYERGQAGGGLTPGFVVVVARGSAWIVPPACNAAEAVARLDAEWTSHGGVCFDMARPVEAEAGGVLAERQSLSKRHETLQKMDRDAPLLGFGAARVLELLQSSASQTKPGGPDMSLPVEVKAGDLLGPAFYPMLLQAGVRIVAASTDLMVAALPLQHIEDASHHHPALKLLPITITRMVVGGAVLVKREYGGDMIMQERLPTKRVTKDKIHRLLLEAHKKPRALYTGLAAGVTNKDLLDLSGHIYISEFSAGQQ